MFQSDLKSEIWFKQNDVLITSVDKRYFFLPHVTFLTEETRLGRIRMTCFRGRVSLLRTIPNDSRERLDAKDEIIVPTCRPSCETPVLLAQYSALATIIIFSLGIWCHKFDLVISFTDCTRATKREENDGEESDARARPWRKRKGQTM